MGMIHGSHEFLPIFLIVGWKRKYIISVAGVYNRSAAQVYVRDVGDLSRRHGKDVTLIRFHLFLLLDHLVILRQIEQKTLVERSARGLPGCRRGFIRPVRGGD